MQRFLTCSLFVEKMFHDYPNHELFNNSEAICLSMYSGEDANPRGCVTVDNAISHFKETGLESFKEREWEYAKLVYADNRVELEMYDKIERYPCTSVYILLAKDPAVIAKLKEEYSHINKKRLYIDR